MNMWMHVHGIEIKKWKINPNSNMWKENKQTNNGIETQNYIYIYIYIYKGSKTEALHVK